MALIPHPVPKDGGGGGTVLVENDHKRLVGLLGGSYNGHYPLTKEQYEKVLELIATPVPPPPVTTEVFDGGTAGTADAEYNANRDRWLDGGYSPDTERGPHDAGGAFA